MTVRKGSATKPGCADHEATGLVARAKAGDQAAFEKIYRQHVGRVYGICLRMLCDQMRAEELTQRIFVRAWMKLDSFRAESSFSSWIYRLSVNMVLDELQSFKRESCKAFDCEISRVPAEPSINASPDMQMDLERAVASLPPQARLVFVMHDIEGHRHKEIADVLGVAVGTAKAQLHRARRLLRGMLRS